MRVGLTLTQCWHRVPGGTAVAALGLADALVARSDVQVVGIAPSAKRAPTAGFSPSIPLVHLPAPYQAVYELWHAGIFAPESRAEGLDVVHASTIVVPPTRRAPLVVTVHDLYPVTMPEVLTARGARILRRGLELAKKNATIVCCPSHHTAQSCVDWGFDADRIRVVPWAVDAEDAGWRAGEVARRHHLDRPYVLWVGTLEPRKNLRTLLEAYDRADPPGVDLVLVGPAGWGSAELPAVASGRVHRLGFVSDDDKAALLAGARALAMPSLQEGFGLPALEALAQGTPVIGPAGTAVAEIVSEAGMLVEPLDVDGWVDAIRAAADGSWKAKVGEHGRRRSLAFSPAALARRQVAAYRDAGA